MVSKFQMEVSMISRLFVGDGSGPSVLFDNTSPLVSICLLCCHFFVSSSACLYTVGFSFKNIYESLVYKLQHYVLKCSATLEIFSHNCMKG